MISSTPLCIFWSTDCHLNFVNEDGIRRFLEEIKRGAPDVLCLGGDISHGRGTLEHLLRLREGLSCPIYFVLGNHDYYSMSIASQRAEVQKFCSTQQGLVWLPSVEGVELAPGVGLVGHGGWGDGRFGDFLGSRVALNDYIYIRELSGISQQKRLETLHALGDEAAAHVRRVLPEAVKRWERVFFLTHVPPFREACVHQGKPSDDQWAPHFSCKAVGDALLEIMESAPSCRLTVLCGHTHGDGYCQMLPNLEVWTGGAVYGSPQVQRQFVV